MKEPIEGAPKGPNGQPIPHLVTVIACAGQDKALSVWITSNSRPLVITQDLAVKSISDLAWSPDGRNLFATSLDGSIIAVMFDEGELGHTASFEENEKALAKFGIGRRAGGIVEGPGGLLLEERSREGELRGVEGRMGALMGDSHPETGPNGQAGSARPVELLTNGAGNPTEQPSGSTNGHTNGKANDTIGDTVVSENKDTHTAKLERLKQRVTITKDGKKRIAPLLVSSSGAAESSLPRSQLMASSSSGQAGMSDTPKTVLDLSKPFDGLPKGGLAALLLGNKRKYIAAEGDGEGRAEKRLATASKDGAVPILSNTVDGLALATPLPPVTGQITTPEFIRPAVINPNLAVSQVRLAVPKLRAVITQEFGKSPDDPRSTDMQNGASEPGLNQTRSSGTQTDVLFEARNLAGSSTTGRLEDRDPARLAVTKRGQPIWQDFLPRSVLLMTGTSDFLAVACEDGSVYAWTPAGRRLINAMILESQAVILESKNSWLLCITAVGMCYVWDMKTLSSPHPPVSLAPILDIAIHSLQSHPTKAPSITSARLNSEGRIMVTLSNGDGYTYSSSMYTWQRLSDVWWAVGSQYWNTADSSVGNLNSSGTRSQANRTLATVSAGVISYLERNTTHETLLRGRAHFLQRLIKQLLPREGFEGFESSVSIAHLENRLAAAMTLGAKEEFQIYLYMYARRLGSEGLKLKVEELLRLLLGDIGDWWEDSEAMIEVTENTRDRTWEGSETTLCGWSRKESLRGVVLILGKMSSSSLKCLLTACRQIPRSPANRSSLCKDLGHYAGNDGCTGSNGLVVLDIKLVGSGMWFWILIPH